MNNSKIMVVDDEVAILKLLEVVLRKEGFVNIKVVNDSRRAVEIANIYNPDIIILDIMMPSVSGFEVFREIKRFSDVSIIFLSAKCDELDRIIGLGLGADDYITKPFNIKEVVLRVKIQLKRTSGSKEENLNLFKDREIKFGDIVINEEKGEVLKAGQQVVLTAKEYQILIFLANNSNKIFSKTTLCEKIWGYDYDGYDNTIMVHIRHLREKIEDNPSKPEFIKTLKGLGYKLVI